jgi:hypothetical protein
MRVHGIDFTSAPRRRKPIIVASGRVLLTHPSPAADPGAAPTLIVERLERLQTFEAFDAFLARPGPWVGGFDLPFGFPRELIASLGWPTEWAALIGFIARLPRAEMIGYLRSFCAARPVGRKFAHRACDGPAGSSPSMKWVNPPVAIMLQTGVPRLVAAGLTLPRLHPGDPDRIALEAYPGLLARAIVGRTSYKSDDRHRHTEARRLARVAIVTALEQGHHPLTLTTVLGAELRTDCLDDASGDCLDAVLCLVQAAWASGRRESGWGLPAAVDPLEGWIVGA